MTATRPAKLYSPALLGLATGLARFPFNPALPLQAEARSRTCGSAVTPGLAVLAPAREHAGRHGALLLPWKAACMALSSGAACG